MPKEYANNSLCLRLSHNILTLKTLSALLSEFEFLSANGGGILYQFFPSALISGGKALGSSRINEETLIPRYEDLLSQKLVRISFCLCERVFRAAHIAYFWIFQTCLPLKRAFPPGTKHVLKTNFEGREGLSLAWSLCTLWEALHIKNLVIPTCLRGCWTSFWAFLGHRGGTRVARGTHVRVFGKGVSEKEFQAVRALRSQVRSVLPPKQKRDTPRNFEMKRLFRNAIPNALSVRKRSVTKGVCTGYLAHVPRYVPFYLQNSKGIPPGTST